MNVARHTRFAVPGFRPTVSRIAGRPWAGTRFHTVLQRMAGRALLDVGAPELTFLHLPGSGTTEQRLVFSLSPQWVLQFLARPQSATTRESRPAAAADTQTGGARLIPVGRFAELEQVVRSLQEMDAEARRDEVPPPAERLPVLRWGEPGGSHREQAFAVSGQAVAQYTDTFATRLMYNRDPIAALRGKGGNEVLSTQHSILSTENSVLGTRYSVLGTRYSVLRTPFLPLPLSLSPPTTAVRLATVELCGRLWPTSASGSAQQPLARGERVRLLRVAGVIERTFGPATRFEGTAVLPRFGVAAPAATQCFRRFEPVAAGVRDGSRRTDAHTSPDNPVTMLAWRAGENFAEQVGCQHARHEEATPLTMSARPLLPASDAGAPSALRTRTEEAVPPALPAGSLPGTPAGLPADLLRRLTEQVVQALDARGLATRERFGRF